MASNSNECGVTYPLLLSCAFKLIHNTDQPIKQLGTQFKIIMSAKGGNLPTVTVISDIDRCGHGIAARRVMAGIEGSAYYTIVNSVIASFALYIL